VPSAISGTDHVQIGVFENDRSGYANFESQLADRCHLPGHSASVARPCFKKWVRSQIQARVNDRITIDVTMEVGQAADSVQVTAETPLLRTLLAATIFLTP
jgi:hypothetical protein